MPRHAQQPPLHAQKPTSVRQPAPRPRSHRRRSISSRTHRRTRSPRAVPSPRLRDSSAPRAPWPNGPASTLRLARRSSRGHVPLPDASIQRGTEQHRRHLAPFPPSTSPRPVTARVFAFAARVFAALFPSPSRPRPHPPRRPRTHRTTPTRSARRPSPRERARRTANPSRRTPRSPRTRARARDERAAGRARERRHARGRPLDESSAVELEHGETTTGRRVSLALSRAGGRAASSRDRRVAMCGRARERECRVCERGGYIS